MLHSRSISSLTAGIFLLAWFLFSITAVSAQGNPSTAWSAQLHVHGSFSEGFGSMETQSAVSRDAGVDAVWWSDHDGFFIQHHLASTFGFEDWSELMYEDEDWEPSRITEITETKSFVLYQDDNINSYDAIITAEQALAGSKSFRIDATSNQSEFQSLLYQFTSQSGHHKRALAANVLVDISVYPLQLGPDSRAVINIMLSMHLPRPGQSEWEQLEIEYYLDNTPGALPYEADGVYYVPLTYVANQWNTYVLPVTDDAIAGFPHTDGNDNSLYQANIGVASRNGQEGTVYFDRFKMRSGRDGVEVYDQQALIMDNLSAEMPEIHQLQGVELSYAVHMNEFGENIELPDYDQIAAENGFIDENGWISNVTAFNTFAAKYLAKKAHENGNLVSLNHLFGTNTNGSGGFDPADELADLLADSVYHADIVEVGYRARGGNDLNGHLWVWDELNKAGYFLLGTGVTDSHGQLEGTWDTRKNNMISWIYADSPAQADMLDGMKRGRIYFGDISLFDGKMDLTTPQGFGMGQVVVTDRDSVELTIDISGLAAGDSIRLIRNGALVNSFLADGTDMLITDTQPIESSGTTFFRTGVYQYSASQPEKAFSNPIFFIKEIAAGSELSHYRAGIDLGGMFTTYIDNIDLTSATLRSKVGKAMITIDGSAENGTMLLDVSGFGAPGVVTFVGMSGTWSYADGIITLSGLNGTGTIKLKLLESASLAGDPGAGQIDAQLEGQIPDDFILYQNYPNPFNPSTTIRYGLPEQSQVSLRLYNTLGQLVRELVNGTQPAGYHQLDWDGMNQYHQQSASGIYIYRFSAGAYITDKKMLLIR